MSRPSAPCPHTLLSLRAPSRLALAGLALPLALLAGCNGAGSSLGVPTPQEVVDTVRRALAAGDTASVVVSELVAGAWAGDRDEDGDAEDWVELHNPGTAPMDLTGFGLSNKTATPFLWVFPSGTTVPAKGYLRVWLSKKDRGTAGQPLHTNFNLDSGADSLYLNASNGTATGVLVDSATPPLTRHDQSWCRMPGDTGGTATAPFAVCATPTPGAANSGPAYASILATPTLSLTSGFYAAAQTLTITGPAGATLRYTTDGSEPTATSTAYTGPLTVAAPLAIRVAAFADGAAPSLVMTGTYVVNAAMASQYGSLKAMMVTMTPEDLAQFEADNKAWRFRASFEYITGATTQVFRMDGEGVSGGQVGSASSPQRTMNVAGRDAFGAKAFPAVFWPDKPTLKSHRKFRLRNGSSDWGAAHLRDQLSQRISADGPNIYGASSTVAMFINGKYYAMMDLREREEETMPAANLGLDKDYVDYLLDPLLPEQEIKNGGTAALGAYQTLHTLVTGSDVSQPAVYAQVKGLMNVESFAYDWALHMYHANYDWPRHNNHVWRSPELDHRWTWRPHDMDFAFDAYTNPEYNMNASFAQPGAELVNALLRNAEFKNLYLNTVADQLNTMTPQQMGAVLDTMAADMRPYIADFYAKNGLGPTANWESALDELRTWFGRREPLYDAHTRSWFNLAPRQPITVGVNDTAMGSVRVNQVDTGKHIASGQTRWSGLYFPGVPITLEARPKPGYTFVGWQGASTASTRQITQTLAAPAATGFPADNFSVRWSGQLEAPVSGTAELQVLADDGTRVWFNGALVIDTWTAKASPVARSANVTLTAGQRHSLVVEHFEATGDASISLNWRLPGSSTFVNIWRDRLYPVGAPASAAGTGTGLTGEYFANPSLSGTPAFTRTEHVNANWGSGAPAPLATPVVLTAQFAPAGSTAAPTVVAVGAQTARTGDTVRLVPQATDANGLALTWSAKTLPKGLAIHPQSGVIYGRPTTPGSYASVVTVTNGVSSSTLAINWTITDRPGSGLLGTSPGYTPPVAANVPPSVALNAPSAGGSAVAGSAVTLSATAADTDGSIARVEFYDGSTLVGTATAAPYTVAWVASGTGAHSLSAKATDNAGASSTSTAVAFTVSAANVAPTVALTVPAGNITVTPETVITLTATASDPDGSIARVEFYDGSTLLNSLSSAPYSIAGTGAVGVHNVTVVAVDNQGASTRSAPVTITIAAATGGGTGGGANGTGTGLQASYYSSATLGGPALLRRVEAVDANWGLAAPATTLPANNFSVRWVGWIEAPVAGNYELQTLSTDAVRVYVNNQLVIDNWTAHASAVDTSPVLAAAAQRYPVTVEFADYTGVAQVQLRWRTPGSSSFVTVPASRLYTSP